MIEGHQRYQLPSLNGLLVFEAVVRLGGVQTAARELNLTSQAVSHQIRTLESRMGHELFVRRSRLLVPTASAVLLAEHVRQGFDCIAEGMRRVERVQEAWRLRLHVSPWFASHYLIPNLTGFTARYPQVDLQISIGAELSGFEDKIDMAIQWGYEGWEGFEKVALVDDFKELVATPELLAVKPVEKAVDLLEHCLISPLLTDEPWQDVLGLWGLDVSAAHSMMRFHTNEAMLDAALAGLGIGLISEHEAAREVHAGRLMAPLGFGIMRRLPHHRLPRFFLLYREEARTGELVEIFRGWLIDLLSPSEHSPPDSATGAAE
ncbi:LysR substrate-binding domain-containing protein [Kushneria aurantia]|uniref:LysR substrate-binding domain-containing protein n=1 Tax=Kushneria aurantia TaxID=504092 RepID=A0ABV6G7T3_9GAMM|nr:LysR substrate-binding domain-containing protein [Kushneria aurantia]